MVKESLNEETVSWDEGIRRSQEGESLSIKIVKPKDKQVNDTLNLLPCPFCGSEASHWDGKVCCGNEDEEKCDAGKHNMRVEHWNSRAKSSEISREICTSVSTYCASNFLDMPELRPSEVEKVIRAYSALGGVKSGEIPSSTLIDLMRREAVEAFGPGSTKFLALEDIESIIREYQSREIWETKDGRPIFGEGSPHDIAKHIDAVCSEMLGDGTERVKNMIYDLLFPNEPPEEREVRWKWIMLEIQSLVEESKPKRESHSEMLGNDKALIAYASHKSDCLTQDEEIPFAECTCGLNEAILASHIPDMDERKYAVVPLGYIRQRHDNGFHTGWTHSVRRLGNYRIAIKMTREFPEGPSYRAPETFEFALPCEPAPKREISNPWRAIDSVPLPSDEYVETTIAGDLNIKVAKRSHSFWRDYPDGDRMETDFKPTHWRRVSNRPNDIEGEKS